MEPIEILKKLKNVKPDPDYSKKSRLFILNENGAERQFGYRFSLKDVLAGILRSGWTIAMTAALLLLAIGSFSILNLLSPSTASVVDLTGLRAEAQAIDAQIQLTAVTYSPASELENRTSTQSAVPPVRKPKITAQNVPNEIEKVEPSVPAASTETENAIDSALETLSQ